jgi:hypothetical protein
VKFTETIAAFWITRRYVFVSHFWTAVTTTSDKTKIRIGLGIDRIDVKLSNS